MPWVLASGFLGQDAVGAIIAQLFSLFCSQREKPYSPKSELCLRHKCNIPDHELAKERIINNWFMVSVLPSREVAHHERSVRVFNFSSAW